MKAELAKLIETNGMAAVLATLRDMMAAESNELREQGNEVDDATADKIDDIASTVLRAGVAYHLLSN